jgi:hypothetical protein
MKKIDLKTTFKSISENRFQKNINFEKRFSKTMYEGREKFGLSSSNFYL